MSAIKPDGIWFHEWEDFIDAANAIERKEKLTQLENMITANTPRDKKGTRLINQKLRNLEFEYNSALGLIEVKKEAEEDFDKVWAKVHKMADK